MQSYYLILMVLLGVSSYTTSTPTPISTAIESPARIVNGYEVDLTEVPYQASLRRRVLGGWAHMCGASIIGVRVLLTAAHCVDSYILLPSSLKAAVGSSTRSSGGISHNLTRIVIHELYTSTTMEHDIALVVTSKNISFGPTVSPVAIPSASLTLKVDATALVTGFGVISFGGSSPSSLLAAEVDIIDQSSCIKSYLGIGAITPNMICARGTNPPRDACQGDSGGPLVLNNYIIGIVSWGENCADPLYPGVYTRVSSYEMWITEKVSQI